MGFCTMVKSEIYKSFHTPVWIIHLVIPVVGAALFVWYDSFSAMKEVDKVFLYIQILSVVFPTLIGVITAMASEVEQNAAGCQLLLTCSRPKWLPHMSKLLLLLLFGICSSLIAVIGFGLGFQGLGYGTVSTGIYVKMAVLLFISMIPLYFIHYMVSFLLGKGYSIGLGIVGSLLAALLLTGLGEGIWWLLPWGVAARFSSFFFMTSLANERFLQYNGVAESIIVLISVSLVMVILLIGMFCKWEGRKSED